MKFSKQLILAAALLLAPSPVLAQTLPIAGYVSLRDFSAQSALHYRWDPILRNAEIRGSGGTVKLHAGSPYALLNGRVLKFKDRVILAHGELLIPERGVPELSVIGGERPASSRRIAEIAPVPRAPSLPITARKAVGQNRLRRIVVDAGHGGHDTGAVSPRGTTEKRLTLDIARAVAEGLREEGMEAVLTRDSDTFIPLPRRAAIANDKTADLFVSIHANASPVESLQGFEVYYLSEAADDAALALERAENASFDETKSDKPDTGLKAIYWDLRESENRRLSLRLADDLTQEISRSVLISAKRVREAQFYVLKWTQCPAVLIETGYITNPDDERRLKNPIYRRHLARAIVRGLLRFKNDYEASDGFAR